MAKDTLSQLRAGELSGTRELHLSRLGLKEIPEEVFELADSLELLNLSQNQLSSLPDKLSGLTKLKILFCSENHFDHVPEVVGACPRLRMAGFKSNVIRELPADALPPMLRWLILTDNQLQTLPAMLGRRPLQKLMLSGNQLSTLPDEMANCHHLELLRLAANQFHELPAWLFDLPNLAWLAIAGNPYSKIADHWRDGLPQIPWSELELIEKLGEGASGVIHRALWKSNGPSQQNREVAVKVFKAAMTSDGLPENEMAASVMAGQHPNLIQLLGQFSNHPDACEGLLLELISSDYQTLAGPPSFDSCTRDVYAEELVFSLPLALSIATGIASAAARLHDRGMIHGDLYAHNILWHKNGHALLGDFGAASFYPPAQRELLERIKRGRLAICWKNSRPGLIPALLFPRHG